MNPIISRLLAVSAIAPKPPDTRRAAEEADRKGLALYQQGKYPEAVAAFHRACLLDCREAVFQSHLALLLIKQTQYAELVSAFLELVRRAPETPSPHYWLGQGLYRLQQPAEAETELRAAIALAPGRWIYHYYLTAALRQQGKTAEAAQEGALTDRLRRQEPHETP